MSSAEPQGNFAVTEAAAFDYGASGRGGWDDGWPAGLVPDRKRPAKKRVFEDVGVYLTRAEMQGRCPAEVLIGDPSTPEVKRRGGIYMIVNVATRDFYIGSSDRIQTRWRSHVNQMRRRKHENPAFNRLVRKHGLSSFRFMVLEEPSRRCYRLSLFKKERQWIRRLKPTLNRPVGGWRWGGLEYVRISREQLLRT